MSNSGTEFWLPFPKHRPDLGSDGFTLYAKMSVFITSNQNSSGTVEAAGVIRRFTVQANGTAEIIVPREGVNMDTESGHTTAFVIRENHAIHVKVDEGKPKIVVYAHLFAGQRSAATLVLPKEALGQEYYSINYQQQTQPTDFGINLINVVAIEPDTKFFLKQNGEDLMPGGVLLKHAGDVFQYESAFDLSGAAITADTISSGCKKFAVFSGSDAITITAGSCQAPSKDPLFQQCYPAQSWGNTYGFIPFSMISKLDPDSVRTRGQYLRVLARSNDTKVRINGVLVATLAKGENYTTPTPVTAVSMIEASQPVCVAQYGLSQYCASFIGTKETKYSDPEMVILNPISYSIKDITLVSSSRERILEQYINVLIKTSAAGSFRINGMVAGSRFVPAVNIPGYSYLQLDISQAGQHAYHLTADDGFNAIAYGFGDLESYAYSAGTNLAANISATGVRDADKKLIDSACVDESYYLQLSLPFITPKIIWKIDGANENIQNNPVYELITTEARQYYIYKLVPPPALRVKGIHTVNISAAYGLLSGGCSNGEETIDYRFTSIPKPAASFQAIPLECPGNFKFSTPGVYEGRQVTSYQWDFGDPVQMNNNQSNSATPEHHYLNAGTYYVRLIVTVDGGCQAEILQKVAVNNVIPQFTVTPLICSAKQTIFKASDNLSFAAVKWEWDFGDGQVQAASSNEIAHEYTLPGNYQVTLTLVNSAGCRSASVQKSLTVHQGAIADFMVSATCVADPYTIFTISKNDGPHMLTTYQWDFGDANSGTGNQSTLMNPTHKYSSPGTYTITLRALTESGCLTLATKAITISNPPVAAFELLSGNQICSGAEIKIRNNTIGDGVSKLEIYFDALMQPSNKTTIENPLQGQEISYTYSNISGGAPRAATIRMIAYAGTSCSASTEQIITLYPPLKLVIENPGPLCETSDRLQIVASEASGSTGFGEYFGPGISLQGIFNPQIAKAGSHQVTYRYTSSAGCVASITTFIQVVSPILISGPDNVTVDRKPVRIAPSYSGNPISFTWQPETGLDDPHSPTPIAIPSQNTAYRVTASNGICETSKIITVSVLSDIDVKNTLTPNGDGINDYLVIRNIENFSDAVISIFDRWGSSVYQSKGYAKPWDGKFNGKDLPQGIYYYVITSASANRKFSGHITLLR